MEFGVIFEDQAYNFLEVIPALTTVVLTCCYMKDLHLSDVSSGEDSIFRGLKQEDPR